jgi:hypothetical protein
MAHWVFGIVFEGNQQSSPRNASAPDCLRSSPEKAAVSGGIDLQVVFIMKIRYLAASYLAQGRFYEGGCDWDRLCRPGLRSLFF